MCSKGMLYFNMAYSKSSTHVLLDVCKSPCLPDPCTFISKSVRATSEKRTCSHSFGAGVESGAHCLVFDLPKRRESLFKTIPVWHHCTNRLASPSKLTTISNEETTTSVLEKSSNESDIGGEVYFSLKPTNLSESLSS